MYGTMTYFIEHLKATVMNNFVVSQETTLHAHYKNIKNEIDDYASDEKARAMYLTNLEKAFDHVYHELLGRGRKNENKPL